MNELVFQKILEHVCTNHGVRALGLGDILLMSFQQKVASHMMSNLVLVFGDAVQLATKPGECKHVGHLQHGDVHFG